MRPARSWWWLGVAVLAAVASGAVARPTPRRGLDAQTGGTLVIGLDQEPPTLDPHASPSAVTYQIIASVTESLSTGARTASSRRGSPSRGPRRATAAA